MNPIQIGLIVLIIVAIWAVIELALLFKNSRKKIDEVAQSAQDTIDEVKPILSKVDGIVDGVEPAAKELPGLMEKASTAADTLNTDLLQADKILNDVSVMTGAASGATTAVSKATGAAVNVATTLIGKAAKTVGDKFLSKGTDQAVLEESAVAEPEPEQAAQNEGDEYFTYPSEDNHDQEQDA